MPSNKERLIRDAILNKRLIQFEYGGLRRTAEPHVYGMKKGEAQLLVYQVGGGSSSGGRLPQWRRLKVSEISNLKELKETFSGARQTPAGQHSGFDQVIVSVARSSEMPLPV